MFVCFFQIQNTHQGYPRKFFLFIYLFCFFVIFYSLMKTLKVSVSQEALKVKWNVHMIENIGMRKSA